MGGEEERRRGGVLNRRLRRFRRWAEIAVYRTKIDNPLILLKAVISEK